MGISKTTSDFLIKNGCTLAKNMKNKLKFTSLKSAREYAKERAIDGVKSDNPHERLVIIDKTNHKIVKEIEGSRHGVDPAGTIIPENSSYVHGHPTIGYNNGKCVTMPISFQDFTALNERNVSDVIAFNELGEFSILLKKAGFKPLTKKQLSYYQDIHMVYALYEKNLIERISKKLPKELQGCKSFQEIKEKLFELKKNGFDMEKLFKIMEEIDKIIKDSTSIHESIGVHKFWKDYSEELGVIYKTNYSYLS